MGFRPCARAPRSGSCCADQSSPRRWARTLSRTGSVQRKDAFGITQDLGRRRESVSASGSIPAHRPTFRSTGVLQQQRRFPRSICSWSIYQLAEATGELAQISMLGRRRPVFSCSVTAGAEQPDSRALRAGRLLPHQSVDQPRLIGPAVEFRFGDETYRPRCRRDGVFDLALAWWTPPERRPPALTRGDGLSAPAPERVCCGVLAGYPRSRH